jgi:hypothetical protein
MAIKPIPIGDGVGLWSMVHPPSQQMTNLFERCQDLNEQAIVEMIALVRRELFMSSRQQVIRILTKEEYERWYGSHGA